MYILSQTGFKCKIFNRKFVFPTPVLPTIKKLLQC